MATMALDAEKVRAFVENLLKESKSLTERDVKAAIGKAFKVKPKDVGAAVIRDVRKAMGIDRPSAIEFAKGILAKEPAVEARKVIDAVAEKFGVRLGPPDVSRMRPKKAKTGRKPRKAAAAAAKAGTAKAAPAARKARGRKAGGRKAGARKVGRPKKAAVAAAPAAAKKAAPARRRGRSGRSAAASGTGISMTFQGSGSPSDLATFFLELGRK